MHAQKALLRPTLSPRVLGAFILGLSSEGTEDRSAQVVGEVKSSNPPHHQSANLMCFKSDAAACRISTCVTNLQMQFMVALPRVTDVIRAVTLTVRFLAIECGSSVRSTSDCAQSPTRHCLSARPVYSNPCANVLLNAHESPQPDAVQIDP